MNPYSCHTPFQRLINNGCWLLALCLLMVPVLAQANKDLEPVTEPLAPAAVQQSDAPYWNEVGPAVEAALAAHAHKGDSSTLLVPIVAILLIFGGPTLVLIVVAVLFYRGKVVKARLHNETVARLVEAGKDVPIELLHPYDIQRGEVNMRRGFINLALGLAILFSLTVLAGFRIGSLGLILIALGAAQLIVWRIADRPALAQDVN